jgi:hypothetical protein
LLGAVERIYEQYKNEIEREHRLMQQSVNLHIAVPRPVSHLQLTQSGLEVVIRYPLLIQNAAEVDDRITRELLLALARPPRLRLVGSGSPNIEPVAGPAEDTGVQK